MKRRLWTLTLCLFLLHTSQGVLANPVPRFNVAQQVSDFVGARRHFIPPACGMIVLLAATAPLVIEGTTELINGLNGDINGVKFAAFVLDEEGNPVQNTDDDSIATNLRWLGKAIADKITNASFRWNYGPVNTTGLESFDEETIFFHPGTPYSMDTTDLGLFSSDIVTPSDQTSLNLFLEALNSIVSSQNSAQEGCDQWCGVGIAAAAGVTALGICMKYAL